MAETQTETRATDHRPRDRVNPREAVLEALRGAAKRGWLGPAAQVASTETTSPTRPGIDPASDQVSKIDLLALAVKSSIEQVGLPLVRTARALCDARAWTTFGYARVEDYARERLGRTGRWLRDQASLGRSLDATPALAAAMTGADGGRPLGKVSALWVGKVASAETVVAWIDLARTVSVRELKETVGKALRAGTDAPHRSASPCMPIDGPASVGSAAEPERPEPAEPDRPEDDGSEEYRRIKMAMPVVIRSAFDETLGLFRAVNGHESSVASFVEALVAEVHAGPNPPDVESTQFIRTQGGEAAVEQALADHTALWSQLQDPAGSGSIPALAANALARFQDLSRRAGRGDHADLDRQLQDLLQLEDELERRLGDLLRELHEAKAWSRLRFASLGHYAEQRLGLGRTAVGNRVRLARVLRRFPELRQAYHEGRLGVESLLILVQILGTTPCDRETERAWIRRAQESTVKRLRDEARALGRLPADGARSGRSSLPLNDAAWHGSLMLDLPESLAAGFLGAVESARRGFADLTLANESGSRKAARTFSARGQAIPSWIGLLAMLEDFVDTWDTPEASPSRRADDVYAREGWRCFAPGCSSRKNLEDHHIRYRSQGGDLKDRNFSISLGERGVQYRGRVAAGAGGWQGRGIGRLRRPSGGRGWTQDSECALLCLWSASPR